jgi:3-hydroxyisobutyrate dehydrogenase-like beta-hydroxyacid dehydrogenase
MPAVSVQTFDIRREDDSAVIQKTKKSVADLASFAAPRRAAGPTAPDAGGLNILSLSLTLSKRHRARDLSMASSNESNGADRAVKGKEAIGFVGLGMMGHGMAKNIVEKGYPLTIMGHRNRVPVDDMLGRGAAEAKTPKEVAERSSIVFICVTGSPQVEAIVRGPNGLAAGLKQGSVIVDCSTADPVSTVALSAELAPRGIDYVDAPLSRTPKEAWEGALDTMVGADDAVFRRVKPIIDTWAARVVHIGGAGDGHRMKLLNNFLGMGYAALYSEALVAAAKVGISPQRFDSVIRNGRMDNPFYQTFMRWTLQGDPNAHKFSIGNAFKDMRYLESMMDAAGVANPIGNAIKNSFSMAMSAGAADEFVPMLATHIARINGVDLAPKNAAEREAGGSAAE